MNTLSTGSPVHVASCARSWRLGSLPACVRYAFKLSGCCRQVRRSQAPSIFLPPLMMAVFSPPRIEAPCLSCGSVATSHLRSGLSFLRTGICQGPFTIIAALPFWNWVRTSDCLQPRIPGDMLPFLTRSTQNCKAALPPSLLSVGRSAPVCHKNGSHWNVPSSLLKAHTARPKRSPAVSVLAVLLSSSQVFGGWTLAGPVNAVLCQSTRQLLLSGMP